MTPVGRAPHLLWIVLCLTVLAPTPGWAAEFRGKVVSVTDGDTITVLHDGHPEVIRLNGIDAPEKGQAFGKRAKEFTASLAFGMTVVVHPKDLDRYGRTIADVMLPDGRTLNQEVVRAGYAWWFRRYSADDRLATLEAQARAAHLGLWADPNPMPPWEWRQSQRPGATARASPPVVSGPPRSATETGPVIGNRRSHVYHRPGCPGYDTVSAGHRVPFDTPREAEAAGYRRAGNCP